MYFVLSFFQSFIYASSYFNPLKVTFLIKFAIFNLLVYHADLAHSLWCMDRRAYRCHHRCPELIKDSIFQCGALPTFLLSGMSFFEKKTKRCFVNFYINYIFIKHFMIMAFQVCNQGRHRPLTQGSLKNNNRMFLIHQHQQDNTCLHHIWHKDPIHHSRHQERPTRHH